MPPIKILMLEYPVFKIMSAKLVIFHEKSGIDAKKIGKRHNNVNYKMYLCR